MRWRESTYRKARASFWYLQPTPEPVIFLRKRNSVPSSRFCPTRASMKLWRRQRPTFWLKGAGHSAAVHSNSEEHIRYAGSELPVSRLVVNQASALTAGGSLTNGFAPTTTLGCGSWGGNSISENLDYKHLMNVSRIGKVIKTRRSRRMPKSGRKRTCIHVQYRRKNDFAVVVRFGRST